MKTVVLDIDEEIEAEITRSVQIHVATGSTVGIAFEVLAIVGVALQTKVAPGEIRGMLLTRTTIDDIRGRVERGLRS